MGQFFSRLIFLYTLKKIWCEFENFLENSILPGILTFLENMLLMNNQLDDEKLLKVKENLSYVVKHIL
jgi:hypothetical protein